jgi:probable phosphoglycerate mutase
MTRDQCVIYLVRHGETAWNVAGRQQGHLNSPLTPKGIAQAQAVGRTLRQLLPGGRAFCIEASPLERARRTAALICAELDIPAQAVAVSPLLIEHHLGVWRGLTYAEIDERYPGARREREASKWDYRVQGGESYALVSDRAKQWLSARRPDLVIIAVTHEMISRTIQGAYGSLSPQETIALSHRHGQIFRLCSGKVTELAVD